MAQRKFFVDLNLNKNQLISPVFEKTATKADIDGIEAQFYYNTDTKKVMVHDGSTWVSIAPQIESMVFKGSIDITAAPPTAASGDTYVVTVAGTPNVGWVFDPSDTSVQQGDIIIYNDDNSKWVVVQRNIDAASESAAGFVQLATQLESNTGSNDTKAVTPLKLAGSMEDFRVNKTLVSSFVAENASVSTSGTTVTHNLNTKDVLVSVYDSNDALIDVQIVATSVNAVVLTANAATAVNRIVVTGYKKP